MQYIPVNNNVEILEVNQERKKETNNKNVELDNGIILINILV